METFLTMHSRHSRVCLIKSLPADTVDPPAWSLQPSYTMPLLSNGHAKTGLTSFYAGTMPRGRLEHVAATCSRYRRAAQ